MRSFTQWAALLLGEPSAKTIFMGLGKLVGILVNLKSCQQFWDYPPVWLFASATRLIKNTTTFPYPRERSSRTIHKPASDLMLLQKRIKQKILDELPAPHSCVTAFTKVNRLNMLRATLKNQWSLNLISRISSFNLFCKVFKIFTSLGFNHAEASDLSLSHYQLWRAIRRFSQRKLVHALKFWFITSGKI